MNSVLRQLGVSDLQVFGLSVLRGMLVVSREEMFFLHLLWNAGI